MDLRCTEPKPRQLIARTDARLAEAVPAEFAIEFDRRVEPILHVDKVALQRRARYAERLLQRRKRDAPALLQQPIDLVEALEVHAANDRTAFFLTYNFNACEPTARCARSGKPRGFCSITARESRRRC